MTLRTTPSSETRTNPRQERQLNPRSNPRATGPRETNLQATNLQANRKVSLRPLSPFLSRLLPLLVLLLLASLSACATTGAQKSERSYSKAEGLREKQKLSAAAKAYADAWRADQSNLDALRGMVELHHLLGKGKSLELQLRDLVRREPTNPFGHEGLGLLLFAKGAGYGEEAIKHLKLAAELAPSVADLHYRLGVALVQSDRYEAALGPLGKAVELDEKTVKYRLPLAAALSATGAEAEAMKQLSAIFTLRPTNAEIVAGERTARALLDPFRGFPESARKDFEVALSWLDADSPAQAMEGFEALLERFPDLAIVQAMVGLAAVKMDDAGKAIHAYREAAQMDSKLAEPELFLADIYFNRGRPDTAIKHYRRAIELNPFMADAHGRLAESLRRVDQMDAAVEHFRIYTLIRPDDYDAGLALATLLSDMRHPDGGEVWDELFKRYPSRSEVMVGRGRYYFVRAAEASDEEDQRVSKRKAIESLKAAVRQNAENTTASSLLQEVRRL